MSSHSSERGPLDLSGRTLRALEWLLAATAVFMVLAFVVTMRKRLHFAFEYDWVEDGVLACVRQLRAGLPLYERPTPYFTPYLYTPVYLYTAAALSHLTGLSYVPLRLLSAFSTLGCFAVIYALVYSEVRRHLPALAAVGFFAAMYPAVNDAFDIGRVDMMFLFFVLCAFYATRRLNPIVAALLWVLAFQTKQGVLPIALLALCHDWQRPRRVVLGVAAFIVGLGGSILWLIHATHGWYRYYIFGMVGGYGYRINQALRFVPGDLLGVCGIALLLTFAAMLIVRLNLRSRATSFYVLGFVGMVLFTGYIRAHRGANVNSLLPAYAWVALLFGIAIGRLLGHFDKMENATARAVIAIVLLAATCQLAQHFYTPNEWTPTTDEVAHREAFEEQVRAIPGEVLVISHPEDGLMAGKQLYAGSESIGSVIEAKHEAEGDDLMQQYNTLMHSGTIRAVATDMTAEDFLAHPRVWMPRDFLALYPLRVPAAGADEARFTSVPRYVYLPCSSVAYARSVDPHVDLSGCAP